MSQYLYFTNEDSIEVRIREGTVIEFDLWVGAANAEQLANGFANEITEKAVIIIGDSTWCLRLGNEQADAKSLCNTAPVRLGYMLYSACMTQILKHCEAC